MQSISGGDWEQKALVAMGKPICIKRNWGRLMFHHEGREKMKRLITKKSAFWAILGLILAIWIWSRASEQLVNFGNFLLYGHTDRYYAKFTQPLEPEVQKDLCAKFDVKPDDALCTKAKVYAFEFYPTIKTFFDRLPQEKRHLSFVDLKIGLYEYLQNYSMGGKVDSRFYDFTGDEKFPLGIVFDEAGNIQEIITDVGRGSGGP